MRLSGRITAAIEILSDFDTRRVPLKTAIGDWARSNRYAGAKDRAFISGLLLDTLRCRGGLAALLNDTPRWGVLAVLGHLWDYAVDDIAEAAAEEPHGPGPLDSDERTALSATSAADVTSDLRNMPDWTHDMLARAFGDEVPREAAALCQRADIDLRINTLKTEPEKALAAIKKVDAKAHPFLKTGARIEARDPSEKAPAVTVIPAFNKGWVEVQDIGSQLATAAAGSVKGAQVLDYCAGGGGKTLALAALMENTGQLYAHDIDPRRLKPLYHRAKRAGVRNLQIRSPAGDEGLDDLVGKMDVVFLDAPCSGVGTWRRHPDTKWRLTPQQLSKRQAEQQNVLRDGASFVAPNGIMVWVTCSFLMEENEDQLEEFLGVPGTFEMADAITYMERSGIVAPAGLKALAGCVTPQGAIRLTPARTGCDGFFIAVLKKRSA